MEQLQSKGQEMERHVLLAQDLVDLGDQPLPVQSLEQSLHRHLLNLVRKILNSCKVTVVSLAILDQGIAHLVEEFEHRDLDAVKFKMLQVCVDALVDYAWMAL
jgi:hypothetical protein